MKVKKFYLTVALSISVLLIQAQEQLQEGILYNRSNILTVPDYGIQFQLPAGWSGMLPVGADKFVMASQDNNSTVILLGDRMPEAVAKEELSKPVQLDQTITLVPEGAPVKEGSLWTMNYLVNGAQAVKSSVIFRSGPHGYSFAGVLISLPAVYERDLASLKDILAKAVFSKPVVRDDGNIGEWRNYLAGRALKYYNTTSGYSTTDFIYLCRDGSFYRSNNDTSVSSLGTGVSQGSSAGKWSATGSGNEGMLTLTYSDGNVTTLKISYGEGNKGKGVYLNNSRYYLDSNGYCQ